MRDRIVFLIRSLGVGGAERQLAALAHGLHTRGVPATVVTFYRGGAFVPELEAAGIKVIELGKAGRWDILSFLWRLTRRVRSERPSILYSFLPMSNILALVVSPFVGRPRVVWGVRASNLDLAYYDFLAKIEMFLAARLSRFADVIICNSIAGAQYHKAQGYHASKVRVVQNGIDTHRFRYDEAGRHKLREEWNIGPNQQLIGLVARVDPMKDHHTFLRAAAILSKNFPVVRFICVGDGDPRYGSSLRRQASEYGLDRVLLWSAARSDMPAVYSACDVLCSASLGEGFSNVIAEAMACERPCVVTDVGDSGLIVGECGRVVKPRDPEALAEACRELVAMPPADRVALGRAARDRIVTMFSVDRMVADTSRILGLRPAEQHTDSTGCDVTGSRRQSV